MPSGSPTGTERTGISRVSHIYVGADKVGDKVTNVRVGGNAVEVMEGTFYLLGFPRRHSERLEWNADVLNRRRERHGLGPVLGARCRTPRED